MLSEGLVLLIGGDKTVKSLIGLRLYPVAAPPEQSTFPYLTYQTVADTPEYALDSKQVGLRRIQFDAFGSNYQDSQNVLKALRNVLDAYKGTLSDSDQTKVLVATRIMGIDNFESDSRVYRSLCEYEILYLEK